VAAQTLGDHLFASMTVAGGGSMPLVRSIRGSERLSSPFTCEVDAYATDLDLAAITGSEVHLVIGDASGIERHLHAAVERLQLVSAAPSDHGTRCRFHLVAPQALLRHRFGSRIFQEMNVQQIVEKVFTDAGLGAERFRWELQGSYETREYCVQYQESEWDFVSRLLEDEGIFYFFEHGPDDVVMVFGDKSTDVPALVPEVMSYVDRPMRAARPEGFVHRWRRARTLAVGKVSLDDYDHLRPSLDLASSEDSDELHAREHYEYPGGYKVPGEGTRRAQVRLEELQCARRRPSARTTTLSVAPGRRFELVSHPSADGEYVIVAVEYELMIRSEEDGWDVLPTPPARSPNELVIDVLPRDQLFRPARLTKRPSIVGVQTARVTGPSGEEIHCDEHGRV
jgi:type VI secretion system secreted protein VgrG